MRVQPLSLALLLAAIAVTGAEAASPATLGTDFSGGSIWGQLIVWLAAKQSAFHRELTDALKLLTEGGGVTAAWSLVLGGFLYGIFHAAGPGHGKAVLTTYLLTQSQRLSRGIVLAAAAAFCQGLVAILLVYGLIYLAGWLPRDTSAAVAWSERASFALVTAIGLVLALRAAKSLYLSSPFAGIQSYQDHGHHAHGSEAYSCCGHSHGPSVEQLNQTSDLRTAAGIVLAIGLRPCSGSVLLLVFAKALGFSWAGIGAVAATSAGTALAVAGLAFVAVNARQWASAYAAGRSTGWRIAALCAALLGGGFVFAIGASLLAASFAPSHPLGL